MSSSEEEYESEEDEDYVPEENHDSDDEDDGHDKKNSERDEGGDEVTDSDQATTAKSKVDEIWKNFKSDVQKTNKNEVKVGKTDDDIKVDGEKVSESSKSENTSKEITDVLKQPCEASCTEKDTITITKVYDFAGEEVKITKEVKRDSKEAQNHIQQQSSSSKIKGPLGRSALLGDGLKKRPGGGIGSVLGKLGKKPKLSTLEKSKLDWNQYKAEEGIEEELQAYNKGKQGYLEKVSFLQRTEMRQFQKEREIRMTKSGGRR